MAKKALEAASTDKIDELSSNQRGLFNTLETILQKGFVPIRDELIRMEQLTKASPQELSQISQQMQSVFKDLEPLLKNHKTEGSLRYKRVLLVEDDIDEQINAKMSLGETGVDFTVLSDIDSAKKAITEKRFDIICVNGNFVDLIEFVRKLHPDTKCVFVTSDTIAEHFQTLKKYPELSTIVARHPSDRTFTVRNIATNSQAFHSRHIRNGEVSQLGYRCSRTHCIRSDQRAEIIAQLENYLDSIGIRGGLTKSPKSEELLMNAIYDAPTGQRRKIPLQSLRSRRFISTEAQ